MAWGVLFLEKTVQQSKSKVRFVTLRLQEILCRRATCKLETLPVTQILREIDFDEWKVSRTDILTNLEPSNIDTGAHSLEIWHFLCHKDIVLIFPWNQRFLKELYKFCGIDLFDEIGVESFQSNQSCNFHHFETTLISRKNLWQKNLKFLN